MVACKSRSSALPVLMYFKYTPLRFSKITIFGVQNENPTKLGCLLRQRRKKAPGNRGFLLFLVLAIFDQVVHDARIG